MRKNNRFSIHLIRNLLLLIFFFLNANYSFSQSNVYNKSGLLIVKDANFFMAQTQTDELLKMVDLKNEIPSLVLDLKYATFDNFMEEKLYPVISTTYLRKAAADALSKVVEYLRESGLGIKIWDAYRPYSVTERMWEKIKDLRYVADPAQGSGHNRGISVDLTLMDLKTKKELLMPTGFDNFTDTAHSDFIFLSEPILKNRAILKNAMEKFGFIQLETEWWHFYLPNSLKYDVLDFSFEELNQMKKD